MAATTATNDGFLSGLARSTSRTFFDTAASLFDSLGFADAAQGVRHYRDGTGSDVTWSDTDAARHPLIDAAERSNRARFEANTFLGRTDSSKVLLGLRDGGKISFSDDWDRDYNLRPQGKTWASYLSKPFVDAFDFATNPGTYFRLGEFGVHAKGDFDAQRNGDDLHLTGHVRHELGPGGDLFNFNQGQPGHAQAQVLEHAGEARPFNTLYSRSEPVEADLHYEPDGKLILKRSSWNLLR